jgi:ABC-type Zn uptake system ZnuABC Zn-binding protein ZnuA
LHVVATVPELGSLAREVGGDRVAVTVFAKGTEDPHFIEAKPSFIKILSQADVYIQIGMDMEIGWAPTLLQQARNANVVPGAPGHVDASTVIEPLEVPTGPVDRSMGDIHAFGNPHFLLDPVQGLRVARLMRDRLSAIRPEHAAYFETRYTAFRQRLGTALVGEALARKYDVEKLALLSEHGRLRAFLQTQGEEALLGGWLGRMTPYEGAKAVADHNIWSYFARRFRVNVIGFMEPKPGVPPSTQHLQALIKTMRAEGVRLILASAYYDPRHARFLAQNTGARVVEMANQVGARAGADNYLHMVDYNVRQFLTALGGA